MTVVILDGYTVTQDDLSWSTLETALAQREQGCTCQVIAYERTRAEDTIQRLRDADAVLTNKVVISAEVIAALPQLKYIGVLATGYNVVDCEAAHRRGIVVTNIPAYSTASVAQIVFAHLLNITNSVAHYADARSRWPQSQDFLWTDTPLTELAGKTFGIYGFGNIGQAVARIALAFGMRVMAVTSREQASLPHGVEKAEWQQVLSQADVISLHCPLTPDTRSMINRTTLLAMRPTAILINTGRGPLVDEQAVAEALHSGRLAAYCADVLSTEPPAPDNPLLTAPRCQLTPHIAWATREARSRLIGIATTNLLAFLDGQPVNRITPTT